MIKDRPHLSRAERDQLAADVRSHVEDGIANQTDLRRILEALEDAEREADAIYIALLRATSGGGAGGVNTEGRDT